MKRVLIALLFLMSTLCLAQHQVALSCSPGASTGGAVTGFNFYRGSAPGTESTTPLNASLQPTCAYTDKAVSPLTTYYYVAKAFCPTCTPSLSNGSNEFRADIPGDPQPPPPIGLTAGTIANNQVPLHWTAPGNTGNEVVAFEIFRGSSPTLPGPPVVGIVPPMITDFTDFGCLSTCYYEVKSYGISSNKFVVSNASNIVKAVVK